MALGPMAIEETYQCTLLLLLLRQAWQRLYAEGVLVVPLGGPIDSAPSTQYTNTCNTDGIDCLCARVTGSSFCCMWETAMLQGRLPAWATQRSKKSANNTGQAYLESSAG